MYNKLVYVQEKNIPLRKFRPIDGECWIDVLKRGKDFLFEMIVKNVKKNFSVQNKVEL